MRVTLAAALPLLETQGPCVLVTAQGSLMVRIPRVTPRRVLIACSGLLARVRRQGVFSHDYWGESVQLTEREQLIEQIEASLRRQQYPPVVRRGQENVLWALESTLGRQERVFLVC